MLFDKFSIQYSLKRGAAAISNTKVADAAEAAGKLVGTAAAEVVLGKGAATAFKGIAFLGKTESGMKLLQQIGGATQKAKEAIGALEIPVKAAEIVLTDGSKMKIPFGETKRLDELLKPLQSRALQILSSNGRVINPQIVKDAKQTVENLVKEGKTSELRAYIEDVNNRYGDDFHSELKKTINEAIEETFGARKDLDVHEMLGGHTIEKHVGKSINELRQRLADESFVEAASSFSNKEVANRAQQKFIKQFKNEIAEWLKNPDASRFTKRIDIGENAGTAVGRGKVGVKESQFVEVTLRWS